jgi:antitoxin ParD1/3/4
MNVSLTPELATFVDQLVAGGEFRSASEVVREGLRLLERDTHQRLLERWLLQGLSEAEQRRLPPELLSRARAVIGDKIKEGLDELRRGEGVDGEEFFVRWKRRLRAPAPDRRAG